MHLPNDVFSMTWLFLLRKSSLQFHSELICLLLSKVNCNDDMGILEGKWQGSYKDGVKPTEWSGSADILHRWVSSKYSPVRYGQCWVFTSVLCTGTVNSLIVIIWHWRSFLKSKQLKRSPGRWAIWIVEGLGYNLNSTILFVTQYFVCCLL